MNFSDLNNFDGLQFMPVNENKLPIAKAWQKTSKKYNLSNCSGVGIVCGELSGNLEGIDIDIKYDITGTLFDRYKRAINQLDETLLKLLVVQKTKSGGFHFLYRCKKIEGNLKLANRFTTDKEKEATRKQIYDEEIKKGTTPEQSMKIADKAALNDKVRVLIETRGEGGYLMCTPSTGYFLVFGDYYGINEISEDQREILISTARQFNEVIEESRPQKYENRRQRIKGLSPFDDYNNRGDVVGLLENHGWKIVGRKGAKTIFLRPGQTSSASSGNFDSERNWFSVFTTSTEFNPQHAYLPYAVYTQLEHNGNFSEATKKLYELGFGDRDEEKREINKKTPSRVSLLDDDFSFLDNPNDYKEYLKNARAGTLPQGLKTYLPGLDQYFLFKRSDLVMINGVDNVGKTIVIIFLQLLAAMYHDWKFIVFSCENSNKSLFKRLMEFYWGINIQKMNDIQYNIAYEFVRTHFEFINSDEDLYNHRDILNMTKKVLSRQHLDGGLIDPYNGLKIELTNSSKLNTHEYHYEAISEIKQFGNKNDFSWFINNHAVTSALRQRNDEGFQKAPGKEDTEGGGKFSNKAAQFITVHRLTQHPINWMLTELHIRKVKETETGGKVTPKNIPYRLIMNKGACGFSEVLEVDEQNGKHLIGADPIWEFHNKHNKPKQQTLEFKVPDKVWTPYKDPDDNNDESLPF